MRGLDQQSAPDEESCGRGTKGGIPRRNLVAATCIAVATIASCGWGSAADRTYGPGVSDTEIKIGNTSPYSGPASAFSMVAKTEAAFFRKVNEEGGINGRKITFLSYDDGYSPSKTVEQTRRLVESDEVLLVFNAMGTATNSAVQKYLNAKKVPQLFVSSGAAKWNDPRNFPWTIGFTPSYETEAEFYAKYLLEHRSDARIAILFQNDDLGKDYVRGLKRGLGPKAQSMIVTEEPFDVSEPTIDSHLVKLKATGADVLLDVATPKFAAQVLKRLAEIGWRPLHILSYVSASIGSVIKPVGIETAQGAISAAYFKDPNDPAWKADAGFVAFSAFVDRYIPAADRSDTLIVNGYNTAQALVHVLKECGDDLSRENVMRVAANLKDVDLGMLLPGIQLHTSPDDFAPIKDWRLMRFEGSTWHLLDAGGGPPR
ncbi:ABC transporter substrate-binding protein [Bradyrhizobium diazoefficiens]|uniref:ABC transporter substrate-binding protein n=1 Tax=Bradyrhizobium diazoefficiens TaxID=1355477 RepID=UPI00190A3F02|nr:ABC transporter substrate-binding protein [Bradyrhizobium diazoefficiens]QQO12500.1 ABC transporter substrate-binding protein [Bradyrhizobium diazoefficiens]